MCLIFKVRGCYLTGLQLIAFVSCFWQLSWLCEFAAFEACHNRGKGLIEMLFENGRVT